MSITINQYMTAKEAAKAIKISVGRLYQLVNAGRIDVAERVGMAMLFRKAEIEKFAKTPRIMGRPKKNTKKS